MPISGKAFEQGNISHNPEFLDFFVKNKDNAYSLTELKQKFGDDIRLELFLLVLHGQVEQKYLRNDYFYRLKIKNKKS